MKLALFPATLGAALALVAPLASAQPGEVEPFSGNVHESSPVENPVPRPDLVRGEDPRATGNNPFLQRCESSHCAAVLLARDYDGLPGEAGDFVEMLRVGATTGSEWPEESHPTRLVAAVYQDGELVHSDSREVSFPGLVYEGEEAPEDATWIFGSESDRHWIAEVFVGGQAPFTSRTDNPDATSDLEGADYVEPEIAGQELAPEGRRFDRPGDNAAPSGQGAIADFIGQDYVVGYPGGDERIVFEADPVAFNAGQTPQSLGEAFIGEPFFQPDESGRIGVLVIASPAAVPLRDRSPAPESGFQSFGIVVSLDRQG